MYTIVAQRFSRFIAIALLNTMVAAGAGTMCLWPALAAHSPAAGCHSSQVPSPPQPADYRCCMGGYSSALLTNIFSPRPALQTVEAGAIHALVAANEADGFAAPFTPINGPPGFLILRI